MDDADFDAFEQVSFAALDVPPVAQSFEFSADFDDDDFSALDGVEVKTLAPNGQPLPAHTSDKHHHHHDGQGHEHGHEHDDDDVDEPAPPPPPPSEPAPSEPSPSQHASPPAAAAATTTTPSANRLRPEPVETARPGSDVTSPSGTIKGRAASPRIASILLDWTGGNSSTSSLGSVSSSGEDGNDAEAESEITVESLGPPDRVGWLAKYSGQLSAKKAWRKRYFVLKGNNLHFFVSPTSKAVGVLRMQGYKVDSADQETGKLNAFQAVKLPNKMHYFVADTPDEKQAWMKELYLASVLPADDFSRQGTLPGKKPTPVKKKEEVATNSRRGSTLRKADFKELEITLNKETGMTLGLDIRVNLTEGTVISKIIPGGAAERCGQLRAGDRITMINGTSIVNWATETVVGKMRSLVGEIKFVVQRPAP